MEQGYNSHDCIIVLNCQMKNVSLKYNILTNLIENKHEKDLFEFWYY